MVRDLVMWEEKARQRQRRNNVRDLPVYNYLRVCSCVDICVNAVCVHVRVSSA